MERVRYVQYYETEILRNQHETWPKSLQVVMHWCVMARLHTGLDLDWDSLALLGQNIALRIRQDTVIRMTWLLLYTLQGQFES